MADDCSVEVIDNTKEARDLFMQYLFGAESFVISRDQINSLLNGRLIAMNTDEYAIFLELK